MAQSNDISPLALKHLRHALGPNLAAEDLTQLERGRYANANVYRYTHGPHELVIKEFYSRPWWIRHTLGRFLIGREVRALAQLDGIPGIPGGGRRIGYAALSEAFIDGIPLARLRAAGQPRLPKSFFLALRQVVNQMHAAGVAHLDLRNLGNVICGKDGRPYILDFQTAAKTRFVPKRIRRLMEDSDRSGVCKCWIRLCDEPLDPQREAFMQRFQSIRKFWIFKGYWFHKTWPNLIRRRSL